MVGADMAVSETALRTYIHLMPCWPAEMPIVWLKVPTLRGFGADARKWPNKVTLRVQAFMSLSSFGFGKSLIVARADARYYRPPDVNFYFD